MSITESFLKFLAARFNIPGDALDYFFASGHIGRGAETILPFPAELIPIGARLVTRGWINNKFFPSNRDWILPYWAECQFNPHNPAFMPRGFNLYTINYTHRDWTMVGNLEREREAIVDPRGLVTPWLDGWSLDVWLETDGALFVPSRLPDTDISQSLNDTPGVPIVVTEYQAMGLTVKTQVFGTEREGNGEFVAEQITVSNPTSAPKNAMLYVAVRPFNPEGVALVKDIEFVFPPLSKTEEGWGGGNAILVNHAIGVLLDKPDAVACCNFEEGDVALTLPVTNGKTRAHCDAGLATAIAAYRIELGAGESKTLNVAMPMKRIERDDDDPSPITNLQSLDLNQLRTQTIAQWHDKLAQGMRVRLPDENLQNAFDANKAYLLLLHDGESITPGPYTYHQFWFRDAAYMLNALDKIGYHAESTQVVERFYRRVQKDGYLQATEGEWDSNGAAIWAMVENAKLTGDWNVVARNYWSLLRMASWINSKRQKSKGKSIKSERSLHYGLLPSGMSAEHLGPSDYFYWDDFWGLAGLREAALAAEVMKQTDDAKKLRANESAFRADIEASLAAVAQKIGRTAIPASPYRRLDAAMIGNLAALYPLRLFDANDARIVDTLTALRQYAWMEDTYFNHVGHSSFGTYLALHVAQCYLFQRNPDAWPIIQWLMRHATPTFTWAEGIHPITRHGNMGDGHHGWAVADLLLAVRNALLFEEGDHLVITPAMPQDWTNETNVIKVENAPTYFGTVSYTIAFSAQSATLVLNANWRSAPAYIEWNLPFALREAGGDVDGVEIVAKAVRLPRGCTRAVVMW
jgi:hypothetical protein